MNEKKGTRGYVSAVIGIIVTLLGVMWLIMMLVRKQYNYVFPAVLLLVLGLGTFGVSMYIILKGSGSQQ